MVVCATQLFDVRAYEKGPFLTFAPDLGSRGSSCIKFSNDGKLMLLSTTNGRVLLLDAFKGDLIQCFSGHANQQGVPLEACFSADAEYILAGAEDGSIWRWHTRTGQVLPALKGHPGAVGAIKCNPTRMMMASACSVVCMWLPKL